MRHITVYFHTFESIIKTLQPTNRASFKLKLSVVVRQNSFLNVCNVFGKAASEITELHPRRNLRIFWNLSKITVSDNYPSCDITYIVTIILLLTSWPLLVTYCKETNLLRIFQNCCVCYLLLLSIYTSCSFESSVIIGEQTFLLLTVAIIKMTIYFQWKKMSQSLQ